MKMNSVKTSTTPSVSHTNDKPGSARELTQLVNAIEMMDEFELLRETLWVYQELMQEQAAVESLPLPVIH